MGVLGVARGVRVYVLLYGLLFKLCFLFEQTNHGADSYRYSRITNNGIVVVTLAVSAPLPPRHLVRRNVLGTNFQFQGKISDNFQPFSSHSKKLNVSETKRSTLPIAQDRPRVAVTEPPTAVATIEPVCVQKYNTKTSNLAAVSYWVPLLCQPLGYTNALRTARTVSLKTHQLPNIAVLAAKQAVTDTAETKHPLQKQTTTDTNHQLLTATELAVAAAPAA